ncbi:Cnl2/NKP2 family protein-domain-containing protein [Hyaloscypha finlandica]|nr:Cnl2/NKP2 family protein-domain-containing protein [Hyaloscypha finlandica]
MPPTEATLLSAFLLPPAPLPAIITLKSFTQLFPKSQQSSPQVKALYRDLQNQRARITDAVAKNIIAEVKRGNAQRRAVVRARREAEKEEQDDDVAVETALFGQSANLPISIPHTLTSILPELESAVEDVEDEIRRLDEEAGTLLEEMRNTVGGLSDLRYGRLANGQLREQVLEGLERLEKSCEKK